MTDIKALLAKLPSPPYLITGSSGFIGRHLIELLEHHHVPLHLLVRNPARLGSRPPGTRVFQGDITRIKDIETAMEGCHAVFHLASHVDIWAGDPSIFHLVNVEGTRNVCQVALRKQIRKLVMTSTAGTLGDSRNGNVLHEGTIPSEEPMNAYEASKRVAEHVVREYATLGLDGVIVMPSRAFAPGSRYKSNGYAVAIDQYARGRLCFIPGTGNEIGNYAFVHDVVKGHLQAMAFGKIGERYLLGGENIRFRDVFQVVREVCKVSYRMIPVPNVLLFLFATAAMAYSKITGQRPVVTPAYTRRFRINYILDLSKSIRELGYQVTPFKRAVEITLSGLEKG